MRKLFISVLVLCSLNVYASDRPPTTDELKVIATKVANSLKDPDSAKISDVRVSAGETRFACGMVNAKNSYGGYTGKRPFMGLLDGKGGKQVFGLLGIGETDADASILLKMCSDKLGA